MKAGFIGAGKLGFSLGKFFADHGIHVTGYYSRSIESAGEAARFTDSRCYDDLELLVNDSDALFLTVPDEAIRSTYEKIKEYDIAGKQICHCSGALSAAETFPDAGERGAQRYSIHPLFPVSDRLSGFREMPDAFFCLEGDDSPGLEEWKTFLKGCTAGTRILDSIISSEDMKLYAAASKAVVRIAEAKNPDRDYSEIRAVLNAARLQERGETR